MALIIDANRAGDFNKPFIHHAEAIVRGVSRRQIRVAVGGRLLRELSQTHIRGLLAEWLRSGRLQRADDRTVDNAESQFAGCALRSDDPHVIALASVSSARLLYTEDRALMEDFKDLRILSPKGKIVATTTPERIAAALMRQYGG